MQNMNRNMKKLLLNLQNQTKSTLTNSVEDERVDTIKPQIPYDPHTPLNGHSVQLPPVIRKNQVSSSPSSYTKSEYLNSSGLQFPPGSSPLFDKGLDTNSKGSFVYDQLLNTHNFSREEGTEYGGDNSFSDPHSIPNTSQTTIIQQFTNQPHHLLANPTLTNADDFQPPSFSQSSTTDKLQSPFHFQKRHLRDTSFPSPKGPQKQRPPQSHSNSIVSSTFSSNIKQTTGSLELPENFTKFEPEFRTTRKKNFTTCTSSIPIIAGTKYRDVNIPQSPVSPPPNMILNDKKSSAKNFKDKPLPPTPYESSIIQQYLESPPSGRQDFQRDYNTLEELQESISTNVYPDGPRNVLDGKIFLYSDPAKDKDFDLTQYDLVIGVAKECDDLSSYFQNHPGKEYMHVPWSHTSSISNDLPKLVTKIDKYYQQGLKVLVHCQCGVSRSACVIVAYFMFKFNMGVNEAYELLRTGTQHVSGFRYIESIKEQGTIIEACDKICPNMRLIFELMDFGDSIKVNA
jgi:protein-tyrosine phosphatase